LPLSGAPGQYILVVEDDQDIRDFVGLVLEAEGYTVRSAGNGAEALELVHDTPPLFILLDMWMPVMDGWSFMQAYRRRPGPHAPVVVVSAARETGQHAHEIQADGYLAKPFDIGDLVSLVRRFAPQIGSEAAASA
jgi:CheY-like chemotaxis protein